MSGRIYKVIKVFTMIHTHICWVRLKHLPVKKKYKTLPTTSNLQFWTDSFPSAEQKKNAYVSRASKILSSS